jgi:hypothetical protein
LGSLRTVLSKGIITADGGVRGASEFARRHGSSVDAGEESKEGSGEFGHCGCLWDGGLGKDLKVLEMSEVAKWLLLELELVVGRLMMMELVDYEAGLSPPFILDACQLARSSERRLQG